MEVYRVSRSVIHVTIFSFPSTDQIQSLYQAAVVWKHLKHQNIVPLIGIAPTPLQLVSGWMPGGDVTEYIMNHPNVDKAIIVSDFLVVSHDILTPSSVV